VDLRGVISFRHLSSQLEEIQSVIGKMLLGDFKTYIATEINKDVLHTRVGYLKPAQICALPAYCWCPSKFCRWQVPIKIL
jgi:hypothetical protein